ncbi:Cathepsin L [Spironucleus salmonicida]|uniref:Cathepsin L n=1 Tax=Spironucleus salmonicida TaxID=348837 RepID=V6M2I0_9EUKA|nr:Cathepsin L [Spironucleus salmonicida]|eukprot:EST47459.1 Cathepsin L [Spironucleus salmonicida]
MILILGFIPSSKLCEPAYLEFIQQYNKDFTLYRQNIFCNNYNKFLSINCSQCIITHIFDRDFSSLSNHIKLEKEFSQGFTCQNIYCYAENILPLFDLIPPTVDLREQGLMTHSRDQQSCGGCWAFGISGLLENSLLHDQQTINLEPLGGKQLFTSTQFLLSNIRGMNNYCSGGDAVAGFSYIQSNPIAIPTVEAESNYPYDYFAHQNEFNINNDLTTKLAKKDQILPFKIFPLSKQFQTMDISTTPVISLLTNSKFNASLVKSYLARGIAVVTTLHTTETSTSSMMLASYDGKHVIKGIGCKSGKSNHQVIFIGYGKFKGINAWLVRNSWGTQWGNQGSFYIKEGDNDLCIESYAYAIIPKNYNMTDGVNNKTYENDFHIVRGKNGFDEDNGHFIPISNLDVGSIIGSVVFIVILLGIVGFIIFKCIKGKKGRYQKINANEYE